MELDKRGIRLLVVASAAGIIAMALYCIQTRTIPSFLLNMATLLTLSGATFAISAFTGFLFGIPRSLQNASGTQASTADSKSDATGLAYQPNTNLEQISDWLTKILVGIGLTNLESLSSGFGGLAMQLAKLMPVLTGIVIFGPSLMVYFAVLGFMFGYLWTRLKLAEELTASDARSQRARIQSAVSIAAASAKSTGGTLDQATARRITNLASNLTPHVLAAAAKSTVLWVDDEPDGNIYLRRALEALGIDVVIATTTGDGLAAAAARRVDVIVTDMGRVDDQRAGYTLIEALRKAGYTVPVYIHSRSASDPKHRAEAATLGAQGSTNDPNELLRWILASISGGDPTQ